MEIKKEYYYLGVQSVDYFLTKIVYNYITNFSEDIEFCCNFSLVKKIIKKITSKEYFNNLFNDEKEVYSKIGLAIYRSENVEELITEMFKIEEFLLTIYKKEDNKYLYVKRFIEKNDYELITNYIFNNNVSCNITIKELNASFNNTSKNMLEAKYLTLEAAFLYLVDNKIFFDIKDIVDGYNVENSYELLNKLYEKKFIKKPNYTYIEHVEFEEVKYEVRCCIEGLSFFSVKIHNDKNIAENLASYSMIEMLILQYST